MSKKRPQPDRPATHGWRSYAQAYPDHTCRSGTEFPQRHERRAHLVRCAHAETLKTSRREAEQVIALLAAQGYSRNEDVTAVDIRAIPRGSYNIWPQGLWVANFRSATRCR
jgi:hypothetical protein